MNRGRAMNGKWVVGIVLLIFVVIFTLQNSAAISIKFLLWQFSISRVLMIFILLAVGFVLGAILGTIDRGHSK